MQFKIEMFVCKCLFFQEHFLCAFSFNFEKNQKLTKNYYICKEFKGGRVDSMAGSISNPNGLHWKRVDKKAIEFDSDIFYCSVSRCIEL